MDKQKCTTQRHHSLSSASLQKKRLTFGHLFLVFKALLPKFPQDRHEKGRAGIITLRGGTETQTDHITFLGSLVIRSVQWPLDPYSYPRGYPRQPTPGRKVGWFVPALLLPGQPNLPHVGGLFMVTHFSLAGCPQLVKKVYQGREGRSPDLAPLLRPIPEETTLKRRHGSVSIISQCTSARVNTAALRRANGETEDLPLGSKRQWGWFIRMTQLPPGRLGECFKRGIVLS